MPPESGQAQAAPTEPSKLVDFRFRPKAELQ